jgi:hypothetical protein
VQPQTSRLTNSTLAILTFEVLSNSVLGCSMLSSTQCRGLAKQYKDLARRPGVSEDRAFIMNNIARSLNGLATQLDMLAAKTRDEGG